jgi:monoamine oxidase
LVDALAAALPPGTVRTDTPVTALLDRGSHIDISIPDGATVQAQQVVLALPPRLVHEHIQCTPALPVTVLQALADAPTWMAARAKAVSTFTQAFWRVAGHSGNAFVRHPKAVLAEVFDCCAAGAADDGSHPGALGGFLALHAAQRAHFSRSLPLLVHSQFAQLYGVQAQGGNLFLQDWATEPWTCSTTDRTTAPAAPQADPLLRQPLWSGRLFFGGSETAVHSAGHMEGAIESAERIAHALLSGRPQQPLSQGEIQGQR